MNNRFSELWTLAQQDRKKATTLAILLVIALAMGVRALMSGRGGAPSRASAAPTARSAPPGARANAPAPTMDQSLAALRPQRRHSTLGVPPRDLFRSTWAVIGSENEASAGKSVSGLADNGIGVADDARTRVEAEASNLRLRSTLLGAHPLAVIERSQAGAANRRVARPGEHLDGFRVVRIEAHLVELEKDGVRIVLEQERPSP